jgi:hypothetical protein
MPTNTPPPNYKGFRFPSEIIGHAVWLYFRFSLSFRDVEELLAQRGIVVTYETVRQWCLKFGQTYANELRRRRPRCGDKWHLDEVYREHQRKNALSLASSGSGWQRPGYPGTEPTQQASGETLFSEAPQRAPIRSTGDYHR